MEKLVETRVADLLEKQMLRERADDKVAGAAASPTNDETTTDLEWSCVMCTLNNRAHQETCEACGSPKPVHGIDMDKMLLEVRDDEDNTDELKIYGSAPCQKRLPEGDGDMYTGASDHIKYINPTDQDGDMYTGANDHIKYINHKMLLKIHDEDDDSDEVKIYGSAPCQKRLPERDGDMYTGASDHIKYINPTTAPSGERPINLYDDSNKSEGIVPGSARAKVLLVLDEDLEKLEQELYSPRKQVGQMEGEGHVTESSLYAKRHIENI